MPGSTQDGTGRSFRLGSEIDQRALQAPHLVLGHLTQIHTSRERASEKTGILRSFAGCFIDHRDPDRIEHMVEVLVTQRVFGIAHGYEDRMDHDELRNDPFFSVLVGKRDLSPAAGKSTLNRLELTEESASSSDRHKMIEMDTDVVDWLFVDTFIRVHDEPPEEIVIELDATDDLLYGNQEGRFFHGCYGHHGYLPLYIFCGEHLLLAFELQTGTGRTAPSRSSIRRPEGGNRASCREGVAGLANRHLGQSGSGPDVGSRLAGWRFRSSSRTTRRTSRSGR